MSRENKERYYTYKLNMVVLNILALILFIVVSGIIYLIERNDNYIFYLNGYMFVLLMIIWLIIHEILHGIGFSIFKSVDKRNITFGMFLERGVFYCMCKQNIGKSVILTSLLFPITIIGFITLGIGMYLNCFELVYLSILNIVSSIGDIVMIVYFLKAPNDIVYLDLDDCTSFIVVSNNDLEKLKVLGIELVDTGIYDKDKMKATDKRRLVISPLSYVLIGVMVILLIKMVGDLI